MNTSETIAAEILSSSAMKIDIIRAAFVSANIGSPKKKKILVSQFCA